MPAPISVQLYSLRKEAERDFPGVLERLGRIGYAGVELAGLHGMAPAELRRVLDGVGLALSGAHVQAPIGEHAQRILDEQEALGNRTLVVAFAAPERFRDAPAVQALADELERARENASARGMALGYHNHWWEFETRIDGRPAHQVLFEALHPDVFAEVDVYWARVGGADPVRVVQELGRRARLLHVKDGPAQDPKAPMTAVGEGKIDVPAVLRASPHPEWHVVELDRCATDMFEAIERSHRYLVGAGLSRGRA
jgi:sugar phosphate isomerase/epimerase